MNTNKIKGKKGEEIAAKFLINKGFEILEMNYYASRYGEIDIIAQKDGILVFCEVKTRTTQAFGHPLESITHAKLQKMQKSISYYLGEKKPKIKGYRIDAISVILRPELDVLHIENVFQ